MTVVFHYWPVILSLSAKNYNVYPAVVRYILFMLMSLPRHEIFRFLCWLLVAGSGALSSSFRQQLRPGVTFFAIIWCHCFSTTALSDRATASAARWCCRRVCRRAVHVSDLDRQCRAEPGTSGVPPPPPLLLTSHIMARGRCPGTPGHTETIRRPGSAWLTYFCMVARFFSDDLLDLSGICAALSNG